MERFNGTLKNMMWKYMDEKNKKEWAAYLIDFTFNYNHSKHSTIGFKPVEVNEKNKEQVFEDLHGNWTGKNIKLKFKIGDKVLITRYKSTFAKGYERNFKNEIFTVYKIFRGSPNTYKLKVDDGNKILARFYFWELQLRN